MQTDLLSFIDPNTELLTPEKRKTRHNIQTKAFQSDAAAMSEED